MIIIIIITIIIIIISLWGNAYRPCPVDNERVWLVSSQFTIHEVTNSLTSIN